MVIPDEMDVLSQLFDAGYYDLSQSPPSRSSTKSHQAALASGLDDVFGMAFSSMATKHGGGNHEDTELEQHQRSDVFTADEFAAGVQNWEDTLVQNANGTSLPEYLLAGSTRSPIPMDYDQRSANMSFKELIKQEPYSPTQADSFGLENHTEPFSSSLGQDFQAAVPDSQANTRTTQRRTTVARKSSFALPKLPRHSPTRPLVERQKRQSDDDNESVSSVLSETLTDGTDVSAASVSSAGLPSLPRIGAVTFSDQQVKRQRRDVSMSGPAVAARELRQKKKAREEQLISECLTLQAEAETIEKATTDAQTQLEKLREDAQYLRSLVRSQHTTVSLLEYLQKAPFFQAGGQAMQLDARSMLRQISGTDIAGQTPVAMEKNEVGGICLHINGSNITLHLCSHCSNEAGAK